MTNYKTKADISTFRTSSQREMLGKYLAEKVVNNWTENFVDEDTGETVSIERNALLFKAGQYIDQSLAQEIAFAIQSEQIADVVVCDNPPVSERFITDYMIPIEVTIRFSIQKKKYLVRSQTLESAIQCAMNYAQLYRKEMESPIPTECKFVHFDVINENQAPNDEGFVVPTPFYKVAARHEHYDSFEEKMVKADYDFIVAADEVGMAKDIALKHIIDIYKDSKDEHWEKVRKAQPYEVDSVIPYEYCQLFAVKSSL